MTVRSWSPSWRAFASADPVGVGAHGPARQIPHTIPERSDPRARRAARPGRPLAVDRATDARRNVVERCINRLKRWRGLATRYEKRAVNDRALLVLAAITIWLDS